MSLADQIRMFVLENYIQPAKRNSQQVIEIVSKDIVKELALQTRVPAVCGALDAQKFLTAQNIQLRKRTGPKFGLTAKWEFIVSDSLNKDELKRQPVKPQPPDQELITPDMSKLLPVGESEATPYLSKLLKEVEEFIRALHTKKEREG